MSPLSFLQRPMLWIEAVSKYKATHLQAPNFAFKLTARKLVPSNNSSKPLDLSSVRHIINAAEPVDAAALDAFYSALKPFGLKPNVIFPTYGLAEHTVFVCSNGRSRLAVDKEQLEGQRLVVVVAKGSDESTTAKAVTRLVGCGKPPPSVTVKIVDAETRMVCDDGAVGEIWIDSPSKAAGYYLKPTDTQEDFHASIVSDKSALARPGGYLRTGDLGFFHEGELFICGRLKDLIIVGGRNYYPQDIEATAEAVSEAIRPGCSAAFSIDSTSADGGEQVVLVLELKEVPKASSQVETVCSTLATQVRAAVTQEHSLGVSVLCFLQTRTVPKTSSGKIARAWCRKGYLNGTLSVVYQRSFAASDVTPLEIDVPEYGAPTPQVANGNGGMKSSDIAALRSMDRAEILAKLKLDVSRAASLPVESVDKDTALATMLDSLTLSQLKGLLENNYAVKISDEYLFRESTTLQKLVDVVKLGYAPDDTDAPGSGTSSSSPAQHAAAAPGRSTGLAGALGCPPGVVCNIL
jgi:acyl carrier protein